MRAKHPNLDTAYGGAAPTEDAVRVCQRCNVMLDHEFSVIRGRPACTYCADILKKEKSSSAAAPHPSSHAATQSQPSVDAAAQGSAALGAAYGFAAMLFGGTAYAAAVIATQLEIGFLAAGVGWAIGWAVRKGNGHAAGTGLRVAAMFLVYLALVLAYTGIGVHSVYNLYSSDQTGAYREIVDHALARLGSAGGPEAAISVVFAAVAAMTVTFPVTGGLFGLIFLAIGMQQAWSASGKTSGNEAFEAVRARVGSAH